MSTRRILAFTGIRSDYDLMSGIYQELHQDSAVEFGLVVAGAHLSESYGMTIRNIEADGLRIVARIETLLDSNSSSSRLKSASILLQNCIHSVESWKPDLIVFAGDREDVFIGGLLGAYLGIPTAHFFGGDHASDGNVDNAVRHATTKLASAHFVVNPFHAERIRALGEAPERVFLVGSPALDKFLNEPSLSREELARVLAIDDWADFALLIQHPILGEEAKAGIYFENTLMALRRAGISALVSYPNTDAGNKLTLEVIAKYHDDPNFRFFKNLDRNVFVNVMRQCAFMIGNSSAGLLEAPLIKKPAINCGLRQTGRLASPNVIFCDSDIPSILFAIKKAQSDSFRNSLTSVESPYGDGRSVPRCVELLKTHDFQALKFKKEDPLQ